MRKIIVCLALAACSKKPPPIADGKCLVDRYEEEKAVKQTCVYGGYTWTCNSDSCDRGAEVAGERAK